MTHGGSFFDKMTQLGDRVVNEVSLASKNAMADLDRRQAELQQQQAAAAAERQFQQQQRWDRAQSPTWTTPLEAVETTEWATYELKDPRSGMPAVRLRHPATWSAGGSVTWPGEPGIGPRYAVGASPEDRSCVAERFPRFDFVTGPIASDGGGRLAVPACSGEELVGSHIVPRLRGGRPKLLVIQVQRIDPALYTIQPLRRELSPEGFLAWVEYERDGVPWADEMLVLRSCLPDPGPMQPKLHFASVWSLNASRDSFADVRSTLRGVALSCMTHPDWDAYAAEQSRAVIVP